MKICKIIGFATSSIKVEGLGAYKLVILKNIDDTGNPTAQVTGHMSQVTGHRSQVTGHK